MIVLSAEMARVASIERGSGLPVSLASTLCKKNICVVDEVGRKQPTFRPGTKWYISFRKNADKIFSAMDYYQIPPKRTRVRSNFMFSVGNEQVYIFCHFLASRKIILKHKVIKI